MKIAIEAKVLTLLREVLGLPAAFPLQRHTLLLGAVSALDSVAVVTLLEECETTFGFTVADDELSAEVFTSVDTLIDWVAARATVVPRQ
jgi:acyl carrier protein